MRPATSLDAAFILEITQVLFRLVEAIISCLFILDGWSLTCGHHLIMDILYELSQCRRLASTSNKIVTSLLLDVAIPANVINLFQEFGWVHAGKPRVFVRIYFTNNLRNQRVFKDDVSEALIVHFSEDCVLVLTLDTDHIQQIKPEIFDFV